MRTSVVRFAATAAVLVACLSLTACGSNNTGKIVGKWKVTSATMSDFEKMKGMGMTMGFDFRADGTVAVLMLPVEDKPSEEVKGMELGTGQYKLEMGDRVTLSGIKSIADGKPQAANISVNGDKMTFKDASGSMELVRVR